MPVGVYKVLVDLEGQTYLGIANFGVKPTFENLVKKPLLEIHLLNFNREIYGETLNIRFIEFIREERKFASAEDLIKQIELDLKRVLG